ncbi:MAG: hypothetical protein MI723_18255 [Caulobacterales bacterium]|nr:hypothetical protein [Caulobacterales bacterium]
MSSLGVALAGVALTAALISWAGAGLASLWGPVQAPVGRSNHQRPTPISGGLGAVLGLGAALWLVALIRPEAIAETLSSEDAARLSALCALATAAAALGAADDVFELGPLVKMALLGVGAVLTAVAAGPVTALALGEGVALRLPLALAVAGSALWVFTLVNGVNFMDGANGFVGGSMIVSGTALAICAVVLRAPEAGLLGAALAGAFAGFLPWNAPRAHVFMGDSGALFAGTAIAGGGLLMAREAPAGAVYLAAILAAPLLVDVLATLAWRARHGRALLRAHLDHAYQRRVRTGMPHLQVSAGAWARSGAAGCAAIVAALLLRGGAGAWTAAVMLAGVVAVEAALWRRAPRPDEASPQ